MSKPLPDPQSDCYRDDARSLMVRVALGKRSVRCAQDAAGNWLCETCSAVLTDDDWTECAPCAAASQQRREQESRDEEARRWRERFQRFFRTPMEQVPDWSFARVDSQEFKRIRPKFQAFARTCKFDRSVAVTGLTGGGKTLATIAAYHRACADAIAEGLAQPVGSDPTPQMHRLRDFQWITGHQLARARALHPLGKGEPELLVKVMAATVVVIDEVGFEPLGPELFEVVDSAYRRSAVVVVTTGLRAKEFRARYGDSCWRRLVERGVHVEDVGANGAG